WTISDQLRGGYTTWLDAMTILRRGEPVSPALVSAIYRTVEAQIAVFPALVALESMAALAVAWWLYHRLVFREDRGISPLRTFRFNDQLVWLMVAGLSLITLRVGDGFTRLGANLAVFMGALYALRGLGVVVFVSRGPTFFSATMFMLGFVFAAPVVIGFMVLFGIADSWLDLRERVGSA
ncbi:MAG: YybS family protein, partial [Gemmatimonadota bacterium]|nr:YybS family protein [Gemmatimonadota bacterium]